MKILVTGGSGFVGKHLLHAISSMNLVLIGRTPIESASGQFFHSEIDRDSNFSECLEGVDVIVHCAGRAHIMKDDDPDPIKSYRAINTEGTANLAKQAAAAGVKRFVFISTIKVNGDIAKGLDVFKNTDVLNATDPYGKSKQEAEQLLHQIAEKTGMEIVIIRPPLVYGEGVKANFSALLSLVGKGIPLPFRCINKNKRSLVSVYNLVDLIKICLEHPSAKNQIFLVSDDHDLSTAAMIRLMAKVQGTKPFLLPVPVSLLKLIGKLLGKSDMVRRLTDSLEVDISHTKETLNWEPPYSIESGFVKSVCKISSIT